jgi:hypothetical protein
MRGAGNMASRTATLALVAAGIGAAGCHRADQKKEERANAEAERIAQETTLTSGDVSRPEASSSRDEQALENRARDLAAFRRDQVDFQGRLQFHLDAIDDQVASLRQAIEARGPSGSDPDASRVHELLARRELLRHDLDAIDRATEADWAPLKARITHDLRSP